jgi:hypothetical protein
MLKLHFCQTYRQTDRKTRVVFEVDERKDLLNCLGSFFLFRTSKQIQVCVYLEVCSKTWSGGEVIIHITYLEARTGDKNLVELQIK